MRMYLFAKRNIKEILREPINICFGIGFPLVLLALLTLINSNIPADANNPMFEIINLAPGLAMFGTVFMALFVGMLLSKDRTTSFLTRLFISPMKSKDYLFGYTIPLLIMSVLQATITLVVSCFLGLPFTINLLSAIVVTTITSLLFIGLGMMCGSIMNDKAVGGICGAVLTNVAGWLSGVFMPIDLIGGAFKTIAHILPFYHSVESIKAAINGDFINVLAHLGIVIIYASIVYVIAIFLFKKKMHSEKQ